MNDDLLKQGPREAPEPETAEEKSRKLGLKTAGGAVAGGGAVAAKLGAIGGLGKLFIWFFAWKGAVDVWRLFGWVGAGLVAAGILAFVIYERRKAAA